MASWGSRMGRVVYSSGVGLRDIVEDEHRKQRVTRMRRKHDTGLNEHLCMWMQIVSILLFNKSTILFQATWAELPLA